MFRDLIKRFKDRTCLEAGELREKRPNYVPVMISLHQICLLPVQLVDILSSNLSFYAGDCREGCK